MSAWRYSPLHGIAKRRADETEGRLGAWKNMGQSRIHFPGAADSNKQLYPGYRGPIRL
jgi:hypothetical protein